MHTVCSFVCHMITLTVESLISKVTFDMRVHLPKAQVEFKVGAKTRLVRRLYERNRVSNVHSTLYSAKKINYPNYD